MKVQHIVWEEHDDRSCVFGLCEIEIFYHGGGSDTFICEGRYDDEHGKRIFTSKFGSHRISEDTEGVSGIRLIRKGTIL